MHHALEALYHAQLSMPDSSLTRTVIIAAIDDSVVEIALAFRSHATVHHPQWNITIVDASRAVAPGQPLADARGVHRVVLDPSIPLIAEAPLRSSALLAEWLSANVAFDDDALLVLPGDHGVAHFPLAQRAQGLSTSKAHVGVYLTQEPPIASVGRDQVLSDLRILELAYTTQSAVARADALLMEAQVRASLQGLGWTHARSVDGSLGVDALEALVTMLELLPAMADTVSQQPKVSVCITHHERPELVQQTLQSIRLQSYDNYEVILVDDGSTSDAAQAVLDSLAPEFTTKGWTIVRQENRYLGAARNSAAVKATGEYLLFIDDDDCMRDNYISTFVAAATSSGADILTCFLEYFEGREAPATGTRVHHRWVMPGPIGAASLVQNSFGGANAMVRKSFFDAIGGYTEDFGIGFEDWEFYNRALTHGARVEVIPRPLLWCRWGIGGMQASARKHAQQQARALRPVREVLPVAWQELPALMQGLHARNRDLTAHIQKVEQELAQLRAVKDSFVASTVSKPATSHVGTLPSPTTQSRQTCHVWHTEGLGLSGILSWMWRLRDQFAPATNIDLRLVDLAVLPYGFQQAGADPSTFYDECVTSSQAFLAFLQRTANDVHVVNHAFAYLTSLVDQLGEAALTGLRLIGVCHTDQEYYYANLEKLAPVLRRIIAVSPTCAATLAKRIPQHADKIVTLPAWAVQLPLATAKLRGDEEPLRMLYTGRILHFQKRVFDLVELCTRLRAAKVHAELTIAGDGPDLEELQKRFALAGARSIPVHFEAVRPPWEMDSLLASHHMFVQVSEFEGASVSLMEALAYGLVPAVTVTRSGHDLLVQDVNALTAPVGDMKRLTALIALLARDGNRQRRIAQAARTTAEQYLEELAYPQRFASLINTVAA